MEIVADSWESERIGIAGPPFRVPEGWALIYHGVDPNNEYRLGWALFDGGTIPRSWFIVSLNPS